MFLLNTGPVAGRFVRKPPLRSSERWRRQQRIRGMTFLPDISHHISLLLAKALNQYYRYYVSE